jgi:hypothetical protein
VSAFRCAAASAKDGGEPIEVGGLHAEEIGADCAFGVSGRNQEGLCGLLHLEGMHHQEIGLARAHQAEHQRKRGKGEQNKARGDDDPRVPQ